MKKRFLVLSSLALSSLLFSACDVIKDTLGVPNRMPIIASFDYNPKNAVTKNDIITFTIVANDPEGKPLQYNWTSTKGMFVSNSGTTTSWKPFRQDNNPEYGLAVVSVVISDGVMTNTASVNIFVNEDGSLSINQVPSNPTKQSPNVVVSVSSSPTVIPSVVPTSLPSSVVSSSPTPIASIIPTSSPSSVVSPSPTTIPSVAPTVSPSSVVSSSPTPTPIPSVVPTASPTPSSSPKN
ncbi:MAG: hypothetical protein AABZ74_00525 [Cyanobacteriota bacterium]